jgi:hypothetical protein
VVLIALLVVWVRRGAAPPPGGALVLVAAAALAMGAQSSTALRVRESTAYLTGTLTGVVVALLAGGPRARVAALRQLAAVAVEAAAAALLLGIARPWVPVLAVVLLVAALVALGRPGAVVRQDAQSSRNAVLGKLVRPTGGLPPRCGDADQDRRGGSGARAVLRVAGAVPPAKDTGLSNLPLHRLDQNRVWCQIVQLACDLIAWTQMLGYPTHPARRWESKRLRLRLFTTAASLAHHARVLVAHLAATRGPNSSCPAAPRSPRSPPGPVDHPDDPARPTEEPDRPVNPARRTPAARLSRPSGTIAPETATEPRTVTNAKITKDPG